MSADGLVDQTRCQLSIVIPAHNEERRIAPFLSSLRAEFPNDEIIVVANACADGTARLVAELAVEDRRLRLLDLAAAVGKGGAVRLGLQEATGDIVAFVDADGATAPAELRRLIGELGDADCVIASRWSRGANVTVPQPPLRRVLGRGFNAIVRAFFGLRFVDTQCGAKIFRRDVIHEVIEEVETADFAFDVDLLFQLQRRGRVIREVPTRWRDRDGSTLDVVAAAPRMLASIVRLRLFHSPLRYLIPFIDRLLGVHAIKCRRLLRLLIVSRLRGDEATPESIEGRLHRLLDTYRSERREVTWWTPSATRPIAIEYLRRHRSRFDCVVEIGHSGRRFWTPLYSLKPILMVGQADARIRWPYGSAEILGLIPSDIETFETAIRRALTSRDAYFLLEADGSWSYHPRRRFARTPDTAAAHVGTATATAQASAR